MIKHLMDYAEIYEVWSKSIQIDTANWKLDDLAQKKATYACTL